MRLGKGAKRSRSRGKGPEKEGQETGALAEVAIRLGRYLPLSAANLLHQIDVSEDKVGEVSKRELREFTEAGMKTIDDPYQREGVGKRFIAAIRSKLSSLNSSNDIS